MTPPVRVIEGYVHGGRIGVLVEIGLEASFTAGMAEFKQLAKDLALQVAAGTVETVGELMDQVFVKDNDVSVADLIARVAAELGERIVVTRFVRWDTEDPQPQVPAPPSPAIAARTRKLA